MALSPAPCHPGSATHIKPLLKERARQRPFRLEMAKDAKFFQLFSSFIRSFVLVTLLLVVHVLLCAGIQIRVKKDGCKQVSIGLATVAQAARGRCVVQCTLYGQAPFNYYFL